MRIAAALALSAWAVVQADAAHACTDEVVEAARRHGVPASVALTIAKIESSNQVLAMNIAGWPAKAHSAADGARALRQLQRAGITSVDVGCMQINMKYHPHAFPRFEDAFDPKANADYGVRFLKQLFEQKQSWGQAIASYHSADPARQKVYLDKVRRQFVSAP